MLTRPQLLGTNGAVASTHWLASAAGMAMFAKGGNAFDAAAAAAFVIQVVEPHLNGPGGDVPIMVHDGLSGDVEVICGQGPMPALATPEAFRSRGVASIPGSGLLPACVPGAVGAWLTLLRDRGRLELADILEPAIGYADKGFPALPTVARTISVMAPLFRDEWTTSNEVYLVGGQAPRAGARMHNQALAATYRHLLVGGQSSRENRIDRAITVFYEGFVAESVDNFLRTAEPLDSTGRRNSALLTGDDISRWRPSVEAAVSTEYRGYRVYKPGPWSQGPVFLQQLGLLDGFDLSGMGVRRAEAIHVRLECAKLAFADREAWYGDPAHAEVPLAGLLDPSYHRERRALITDLSCADLRPGSPGGQRGWIPRHPETATRGTGWSSQISDGLPTVLEFTETRGDTCCVSASDADGNMVVASPSGGWLKSSPVVPGLGFALGTRGQMAWLDDGHPNTVAPFKRPRTTLSPTIVLRDGQPYLAFGTPGGDQQDQWTLGFFLDIVHGALTPQEAVEAPTFHSNQVPSSFTPHRHVPGQVVMEPGIDMNCVAALRDRGHDVVEVGPRTLGKVCATGFDDDLVFAAASPRGLQAYAVAI